MADFNLEELSLTELQQLQKRLEKAIATYEDRQRSEAIATLEAVAKEFGYSLSDLAGVAPKRKPRGPAEAKYRHPEDPNITWSGLGRKPRWFLAHIDAGKAESELAI